MRDYDPFITDDNDGCLFRLLASFGSDAPCCAKQSSKMLDREICEY